MEIRGDINALIEATKGLKIAEPALKKGAVSATNKSIVTVRSRATRLVAKEYRVTQKDVRKELNIYKANYSRIVARMYGSGKPGIGLFKFAPTPKRIPSTVRSGTGRFLPKDGIKVMIHRGKRKQVKGAFIARMSSGHVGVFRRRKDGSANFWNAAKRRFFIDELFGPSPLRILDSTFYKDKIDEIAEEVMDKNMAHETEYFLKKYKVIPNV